jgi:hypothetical protein
VDDEKKLELFLLRKSSRIKDIEQTNFLFANKKNVALQQLSCLLIRLGPRNDRPRSKVAARAVSNRVSPLFVMTRPPSLSLTFALGSTLEKNSPLTDHGPCSKVGGRKRSTFVAFAYF